MGRLDVQAPYKKIASSLSSSGDAFFHDKRSLVSPQIEKWFVRIRFAALCSVAVVTMVALYVFLSPYVRKSPEQQQKLIDAVPPRAAQQIVAMSLVLSIPFYDITYLDLSMQSTLDQTFLPSEVLLIISGIPHDMIPEKALENLKKIYHRYANGFAQRVTMCPDSSLNVHLLRNSKAEKEVPEVPHTRNLLRGNIAKKTNVLMDDGKNNFRDCFKLLLYGREGEKFQGDNRVFGFKHSTEEIVTFFGCSDYMLPQRIEVLHKVNASKKRKNTQAAIAMEEGDKTVICVDLDCSLQWLKIISFHYFFFLLLWFLTQIFVLHHELDAVIHRHVDSFDCKGSDWLNDVLVNRENANISSEITQSTKSLNFFSRFFQSFLNAIYLSMAYSNWNEITLKAFPSNTSIPVSFLNHRSRHFISNIDKTVSSSNIFIATYKKIHDSLPPFVATSNSNFKEPNWPGQPHWSFPIGMSSVTELPHHNGWMTIRRRVIEEKLVNMPQDLVSGEDSVFNWRMIKADLKWNAVPMQLGIFCHIVDE